MMNDKVTPFLGVGIGLRASHYQHIIDTLPPIPWFEAITENYMGVTIGDGGPPLKTLEKIRRDYDIVLHGVSLSVGSMDPVNLEYLKRLKNLIDRVTPAWVSDHLCWTGVDSENLHDLLPLPFTEEALEHIVPRVKRVQDFLGRRILLENVSSYVIFKHSEMTEWEFLAELCQRADCGILLDVNNIYVSAINHGFDPLDYLKGIPLDRVGQMHLAGHSEQGDFLVDTHNNLVCSDVWKLYSQAIKRFGNVSTLIEWDENIPEFSVLEDEVSRAKVIQAEIHREEQDAATDLQAISL